MKKYKSKAQIYIRSSKLDERMLSTLIILKTLSRGNFISYTNTMVVVGGGGEQYVWLL